MRQQDIFPYSSDGKTVSPQSPQSQRAAQAGEVSLADGSLLPGKKAGLRGEALARTVGLERSGGWVVFAFTAAFTLFLLFMNLAGQVPGQSVLLKSISDVLQFVGEYIGLFFTLMIAFRLGRVSSNLQSALATLEIDGYHTRTEIVEKRLEARNARRAFWAWVSLSTAIALYATGQALWTSYDMRMPSNMVPFPGYYDIGFVSSYPFFLIGTILLPRHNGRTALGHLRVLLDAFTVIGAALALSWFFVLDPVVKGLASQPSLGAAFLSIYFPGSDLLLVVLGAFLMASPLSTREQQAVFLRLCLGLFFLAITDSLLVFFSLSPAGFNTGTLQDVLWPLSMQMVGLAALAYPQSAAREQERAARLASDIRDMKLGDNRFSYLTASIQTVTPFVLALGTCAVLLTVVQRMDKANAFLASVIALFLFVLVAIRQALTLNENNRLRMQLAGELVLSRRELQVTRREANEATREVQEKVQLEEGIMALQEVHVRLVNGDFTALASTEPGPLQMVAVSLNLLIERMKDLASQAERYNQLVAEIKNVQNALDRLAQGVAVWTPASAAPLSKTELRPLFFGIERVQRFQLNQWQSLLTALERTTAPLGRVRTVVQAMEQTRSYERTEDLGAGSPGFTLIQMEQQVQRLIIQTRVVIERLDGQSLFAPPPSQLSSDSSMHPGARPATHELPYQPRTQRQFEEPEQKVPGSVPRTSPYYNVSFTPNPEKRL